MSRAPFDELSKITGYNWKYVIRFLGLFITSKLLSLEGKTIKFKRPGNLKEKVYGFT
jgi:hypothetical protein